MNRNEFREWLAVAVLVISLPAGLIIFGLLGFAYPSHILAFLASAFVGGAIAIWVADFNPLESGLFLVITCVLAALLIPLHPAWVALPGGVTTCLWGTWLSSLVDRPA